MPQPQPHPARHRPPRAARGLRPLAAGATLAALAATLMAADARGPAAAAEPPELLAGAAWRALASSGPRAGHDAVVDAAGRRMIVHGGEAALFAPAGPTAALDLARGTWSELAAAGDAPAARLAGRGILGGALVLDPAERLLLAQCDCAEGNAFTLDLAASRWAQAPNDSDVPYVDVVAAYEPGSDRAVFFGGAFRGLDEPSQAAYAYDLSPARGGWTALPDVPFLLQYQAFGVDDRSGQLLAFGGQDAGGEATAELWRLDLDLADQEGAWVRLAPGAEDAWPEPRIGATLTFMDGAGLALLYGGYDPSTGTTFGDLWLLDTADPNQPQWSLLDVAGAPAARSGHSAAWDAGGRALIVHGGVTVSGAVPTYFGDTWALELEPQAGTPTATPATGTPTTTEGAIFLPVAANRFAAAP